ncbi:putative membrane protein YdjX (TVP38/TMEM64 family) [Sinobaca qinghaiensis]|uniref:Putative membrane protein YdjX (TVP38/TMEM64 family) n=1 Tax=Sinobaca qinghaiensis TaxID=342944 RepID=A0A419V740_9BACL|nr:VTT domain-containing protein [Sinobaca qinghaiensis]RKD75881.1 putative membrane protein YdjX (TVP38/TMEM64 family) [Sinobaca qinghaiensis]
MDSLHTSIQSIIQEAGWLAPILFIILHLVRPMLFIPVLLLCMAGGLFFGFLYGALYSVVGLSLSSLIFYKLVHVFPSLHRKITSLKEKLLGNRKVTLGQVMVLRLLPFMHFYLLSLYLIEMTKSLKEYMYYSVAGILLPSIIYTAFGRAISEMPWYLTIITAALLLGVYKLFGRSRQPEPEGSSI